MQYTLDNHLQCGWVAPDSQRPDRRVFVGKIGECKRKPGLALDEAILSAKKIVEEFGSDIVLCMSSGVDSECLARAFIEAKIPIRVAIARYMPGHLNKDDTDDAFDFCERFNIPVRVFEIDLMQFFEIEKKHLHFAEKFACRSPQLAVHMGFMDRVRAEMGGVPVFSGNPIEVEFDSAAASSVFLLPMEPQMSYLRYFARQKIPGVPFFFSYSPELIYAFWQTPQFISDLKAVDAQVMRLAELRPQRIEIWQDSKAAYLGKVRKYQQGGFEVLPREWKKTGFETAKVFFKNYFLEKGMAEDDFGYDAFNFFYRKPLENLCPYPFPTGSVIPRRYFPRPDLLEKWI